MALSRDKIKKRQAGGNICAWKRKAEEGITKTESKTKKKKKEKKKWQ